LIALTLLLACNGRPETAPPPLVLLVSYDTTRADAVSVYGRTTGTTPNTDALAASGVRFDWALAPAPATLCSHTAVFTGLDTHGSGVVANGYPLAREVPVLAERFAGAGWETIAVIASSALEKSMGLDRGFRVYDDDLSVHSPPRYEDPAANVTRRALAAVDARDRDKPLFLFVHYFDAHGPWNSASPEIRARFVDPTYSGPVTPDKNGSESLVRAVRAGTARPEDVRQGEALYHAEVASEDAAFGTLLAGLTERGLLDDAAIVLFGDHGEAFDEEPQRAFGHGFDVDLYAIHVPLVIRGTGRFQITPRVVDTPVRLQDLGTTILALSRIGGALGGGRDLAPLWNGGTIADIPVFAEATKPSSLTQDLPGWNNLAMERAVASEGLLFTRARWIDDPGRLFRLDWDQEPVDDDAAKARLGALLDAWDAKAPPRRNDRIPIGTLEALRGLGYVE
jgi:arylsulfatase A-like enzyme